MRTIRRTLLTAYWIVTAALFLATLTMLGVYTPVEVSMGPVQKIFYLHLPVAIGAFAACFVVFVASVGYLYARRPWWDDLAAAAGTVAALFCGVVLLTGMIWGRSAWGLWWTWSPRLTFSLVLFLLYVVYVMLRPAIESPQRRALVSAVYGMVAFLDVPLVYLSVRLMNDIHPKSITLAPEMKITLLAWFAPVALLLGGLIHARFRLNWRARLLADRSAPDAPGSIAARQIGETA